jgi:hypothetical protein
MSIPTPCGSLYVRTLQLVRELPRTTTLTEVATETGIPLGWLSAFYRGEITAPNVNRIQILYEHLSGAQLEVR